MADAMQVFNSGVPLAWYLILSAVLFTLGVAGFMGPPRLTGLGNQLPDVVGGELPQGVWMHGVLLAGVDLR